MSENESAFLKRLLVTFKVEAKEHIDAISSGINGLKEEPEQIKQTELIETIFREAHSLKGAARSVNMLQIEAACQTLESKFSKMKHKEIALTPALFDRLLIEVNSLNKLLEPETQNEPSTNTVQIKKTNSTVTREKKPKSTIYDNRRSEHFTKTTKQPPRIIPTEKLATADTVRISAEKLDSIFLQSEEMLTAKLQTRQRLHELTTVQAIVTDWEKNWASKIISFNNRYGNQTIQPQWLELIEENIHYIKTLRCQFDAIIKSAEQDQRMLTKRVDDLLEDMKKVLMLPFSVLLEIIPRLVSDLAEHSGKVIDLEIRCNHIEADRRILEQVKDPLIHLLRNCVDHGIETPKERTDRNKPLCGKISIVVSQRSGNRVEITISDDGAGIDIDKLKASAVRLGVLDQEESFELDDENAVELIYQSGISTSPIITEVSGRGLGLAIVRDKIERLGGNIIVETHTGAGTTFRIELPLSLACCRGVIIQVGTQIFVILSSHMERSTRILQEDILTVENRETIRLGDEILSLVWLSDVLGISSQALTDPAFLQIIVVNLGGKRIAFVVDQILGEQEILVKRLGPQLSRVRNILAATILGSGKVVPVLNVSDLLKSALNTIHPGNNLQTNKPKTDAATQRILVVDDSITARNLLKGILEIAGYQVTTAIDGIDALSKLRSNEFDLVASDVDMPRMNGFELTAKIRNEKKLADIPVVLITALESQEDREKGIDVGANAYIVKRSFEQSNLLEIVRRLI